MFGASIIDGSGRSSVAFRRGREGLNHRVGKDGMRQYPTTSKYDQGKARGIRSSIGQKRSCTHLMQ